MNYVMRIVGVADGRPCAEAGCYVRRYTPDGFGGNGRIVVTPNEAHARRYPDQLSAWQEYLRTSATHPRRPDGQPNRPLTAYTVEILPLAQEGFGNGKATGFI